MRRSLSPLLVVLAACAAFFVPTSSGRVHAAGTQTTPLSFTVMQNHAAVPVDYLTWCGDCTFTDYRTGSPWVVNPGTYWPYADLSFPGAPYSSEPGCAWDSDDFYQYDSAGSSTVLDAGTSASVNECRYSGGATNPRLTTDILILSSSPNLRVSEAWSWTGGGISTTVTPTFDATSHDWRYFDCILSPDATGPLVTIPDSHGGQAIPQRITVTVTNPTSQKVGKTGGVVESGVIAGSARGCTHWREP